MVESWRGEAPSARSSSMAARRSHLGKLTWPLLLVPSVPMEVMTTSSVAEAKVVAASACSSAAVFVRRRKDLTPETFWWSVTPEGRCQNKGGVPQGRGDAGWVAGTARPHLFRRRGESKVTNCDLGQ